jgi:CDP-diacylglycerol--glycerol-3-phosphate 3-phosphatidyltransferase
MKKDKTTTFTDICRQKSKWLADAFAKLFLNLGFTANMITIIGCMAHVVAFWLIYQSHFLTAGILLLVFACADVVDGTMARMENDGEGTKFGGVLDSVTDRISETLVLGGILLYYTSTDNSVPYVILCIIAIMGSYLVPYTRAKGELYGLDMRLGILTRVERYIVLLISLICGFPIIGIAVIALFSNITALQRMLYIKKNVEDKDGNSERD